MPALISDRYRDEYAALVADPIVQDMAAGLAGVPTDDIAHEDGTPRFEFMGAANAEYASRGGKNAHSIGGVSHALLILRGAPQP